MSYPSVYHQRLALLRAQFPAWGIDAILIGSPQNRRWLSGFTGSAAQLIITADRALLATDSRYWEQAAHEAPAFQLWQLGHDREGDFEAAVAASGATRIGVESQHMTLAAFARLRRMTGVDWVECQETVEPMRAIKSEAEIDLIAQAAAITDAAMNQMQTLARAGITEKELAWLLERTMREAGADGMAFTVIVASGPNAALPHHHPGDRRLQAGDAIVVDMGAMLDGYHSDLTRTFFLGAEPDDAFWEVYNLVLAAQEAALDGLRAGITGKEADALARDVITAAGHSEHFGHGLGHGVGLEIHEEPRLSVLREQEKLASGMVVTVEPGVYIPGWGGVRIEDLALVTENGIHLLSHAAKNPIIPQR